MRLLRFLFITASLAAIPAASSAQATNEEQKGFWQKGAATDWNTPVQGNSSNEIVYRDYPLTVDEIKAKVHKEAEEAVNSAQSTLNASKAETAVSTDTQQKTPLTREQIIAKYGSPSQPLPIRAQKDAAPEMQALFEALNSGDKELAWQYSLALAERRNRIKQVVSKATDYQLLALEATGQRTSMELNPEADAMGAARLELREYIQRTKMEQEKKKLEWEQALANAGVAEEGDKWSTSPGTSSDKATSQIPVDPAGKAKLLIFFDERSPTINSFSKSLKPLQEIFKGDPNVSILGLTMRSYATPGLKRVGEITSLPFPLVNGEALAPELRIQRYPSFVFLAVTSKQTYRVEGAQQAEEIARILNVMKGVAK